MLRGATGVPLQRWQSPLPAGLAPGGDTGRPEAPPSSPSWQVLPRPTVAVALPLALLGSRRRRRGGGGLAGRCGEDGRRARAGRGGAPRSSRSLKARAAGDSAAAGSAREQELGDLKVPELKDLCRERKLPLSGRKAELIQRILDFEADLGTEEAEEAEAEDEESARAQSMKTSVDRFTEALDREDLDEFPLEELFDLHIPQEGELVKGKIMSLVEWGAFVEIESGWSGLLHVSEITDGFVDNIEDYLHPGQEVECMVIKNREDRLDRLSLSMKRLNQPPNIQQALADGRMTPQDLATARPTPIGRRVDQSEELLRSMDIRLSAVEAVLSQLGYGEALREAQHEARDGTKRPSVPSMEAMLSSVPEERQPETTPLSTQNERAAIDMVLADLSSPAPPPAAGGGAAAGPPPGAGEGDRQSAAREVLDDVERREAESGRRRRAARRPARGPELLGEPTEEELLGAGFTGGL